MIVREMRTYRNCMEDAAKIKDNNNNNNGSCLLTWLATS